MAELQSKSPAFRQALRQSERLRIYILLAAITFIVLLRGVRTLVAPTPENVSTFYIALLMVGVVFTLEFATLLALRRSIREEQPMAGAFWFLNILMELSVPSIAIATIPVPRWRRNTGCSSTPRSSSTSSC